MKTQNKSIFTIKNSFIALLMFLATFSLHAQEKKNKNARYDINVKGNCEMCKKRIEKAAFSVKGVKSAEYHLDDSILHLIINEEKCSILNVKKAIAKVGHDADDIKATDAEYEKLHSCCQYERT